MQYVVYSCQALCRLGLLVKKPGVHIRNMRASSVLPQLQQSMFLNHSVNKGSGPDTYMNDIQCDQRGELQRDEEQQK
ncbi:MAG: hypothetical protein ACTJLK_01040 [Anaplasma sp.]